MANIIITECDRIITLNYLSEFVSDLIQSSVNGSAITVNFNGKDGTYCPTYSELTAGTFIL